MDNRRPGIRRHLAQPRAHAREKFLERERLPDVVVRPGLEAFDSIPGAGAGSEHDDGHRATLATNLPKHLEPVHRGQTDIEEAEVDPPAPKKVERRWTVVDDNDVVACCAQPPLHERRDLRLVFCDEDPRHRFPP